MATRTLTSFLVFLCAMQVIQCKGIKGSWGGASDLTDPSIDPEISASITEIRSHLNKLQSTANYVIGSSTGLASRDLGLITSVAKETVKLITSLIRANSNVTEECIGAHALVLDQLITDSKTRLSACIKSSQLQLKIFGQNQRTITQRVVALNTKLSLDIDRCKLLHPLPTDSAAVTECMREQCAVLNQAVNDYEQELLDSIPSFTTSITQIISNAQSCSQQILDTHEQQNDQIKQQIEECSNANNTIAAIE